MFKNREEAGRLLAEKLFPLKGKDLIVLGIPRGGVVLGKVIADCLGCPLDVVVVKKLGAPYNPELAIGAISLGGVVYWDENLCKSVGVGEEYKNEELRIKNYELVEREKYLRSDRGQLDLEGKIVILTDDGVATGATTIAAVRATRKMRPSKIILAVPVIAADTIEKIKVEVDELIYLEAPIDFYAVGQFYGEFGQVEDEEVKEILNIKSKI